MKGVIAFFVGLFWKALFLSAFRSPIGPKVLATREDIEPLKPLVMETFCLQKKVKFMTIEADDPTGQLILLKKRGVCLISIRGFLTPSDDWVALIFKKTGLPTRITKDRGDDELLIRIESPCAPQPLWSAVSLLLTECLALKSKTRLAGIYIGRVGD